MAAIKYAPHGEILGSVLEYSHERTSVSCQQSLYDAEHRIELTAQRPARPTVPILSIALIAFLAMQIGIHPRSLDASSCCADSWALFQSRSQRYGLTMRYMLNRNLPTVVYHADWGSNPNKRWWCKAVREADSYKAQAPELSSAITSGS